jgi:two-component system chemotaxis response regulator CheB
VQVTDAQRDLRGVVAIGGSAGGVEALTTAAAGLPADLPYAVLMALHMPSNAPSVLAQIIDRSGPLPAASAEHGQKLEAGRIYVAVPGRHLITLDHRIVLSEGPTENGHRPALNAMFRSVAVAFGPRAIGVLMSGVLDDGVLGLAAIKSRGGTTLCQTPDDAAFPTMPKNALRAGVVDEETTAAAVGSLLSELAQRSLDDSRVGRDPNMELQNRIAMAGRFATDLEAEKLGPPSGYTCPDCNGTLHTISAESYRCHVGHAWSAEALLSAQDEEVQTALWVAVRSLNDKARLARQLSEKATNPTLRERYARMAEETEKALAVLRERFTLADTESPLTG